MGRSKTTDLLMWIGAKHYPTVTSFVREAMRLGVSKRVAQLPVGVKPGRSLLFLAHDEAVRVTCTSCKGHGVKRGKLQIEMVKKSGRSWEPVLRPSKKGRVEVRKRVETAGVFREMRGDTYRTSGRKRKWRLVSGQKMCEDCGGRGERPDGRIFGFCIAERFELVFDCASAAKEYKERRETLRKHDRVTITYVPGIDREPKRRCGYRRVGGSYLASGGEDSSHDARTLAGDLGDGFKAHGPLVVFPEPIVYPEGRFRGTKVVDKHQFLKAARKAARKTSRVSRRRRAKKRVR